MGSRETSLATGGPGSAGKPGGTLSRQGARGGADAGQELVDVFFGGVVGGHPADGVLVGVPDVEAPLALQRLDQGGVERGEDDEQPAKTSKLEKSPGKWQSPTKMGKKSRSATSNEAAAMKKSPMKKAQNDSQKITNFFGK